jgi:hypothetical protein
MQVIEMIIQLKKKAKVINLIQRIQLKMIIKIKIQINQ